MALKVEYAFSEGSGATAADSSGNGKTLSLLGATWTTGHTGGGIVTANAPGGTVTPFDVAPTSFSLAAWVKVNAATGDFQSFFESVGTDNSLYAEFSTGLALGVFVRTGPTTSVEVNHSSNFVAGTWYHVAYTFNAGTATVALYVNGVLSQTKSAPAGVVNLHQRVMYVGGSVGEPARVTLDDVRMYDSVLTLADVITAMNTPATGVAPGPSPLSVTGSASATSSTSTAALTLTGGTPGPAQRFIVGHTGRAFVDQAAAPILLKGDSPWSAMANTTPAQWVTYCNYLASVGFNAAILDLAPTPVGGGAYARAEAATYDGLKPFTTWSDWTTVSEPYWARVDAFVATAAAAGITLMLVPAYAAQGAAGNNAGVLAAQTTAKIAAFGTFLGNRYKAAPNVLWAIGGDWGTAWGNTPTSATQWAAYGTAYAVLQAAVKAAGDTHLWTVHGSPRPSSTSTDGLSYDVPQTRGLYDFDFGYTYQPTYNFPARSRSHTPTIPVIYGEGNYSGENNTGGPATTNESLRRALLWAYSLGVAGDFMGTEQWRGQSGWVSSIPRTAFLEARVIHEAFEAVAWWKLVPDAGAFLTSGAGSKPTSGTQDGAGVDVLESTYATASVAADGSVAVVYVPTGRSFTVDLTKLGTTPMTRRIDPASGAATVAASTSSYAAPGVNSAGQTDWLYVFTATPPPIDPPDPEPEPEPEPTPVPDGPRPWLPTPYAIMRTPRISGAKDALGVPVVTYGPPVATPVHGWSPPLVDTENGDPGRADMVSRFLDVYAPVGTPGGPLDRWSVEGVIYEQVGYPSDYTHGPWQWSAGLRIRLKRVEG